MSKPIVHVASGSCEFFYRRWREGIRYKKFWEWDRHWYELVGFLFQGKC